MNKEIFTFTDVPKVTQKFLHERQKLFGDETAIGPCSKALIEYIRTCQVPTGRDPSGVMFRTAALLDTPGQLLRVGVIMEQTARLAQIAIDQVTAAKNELESVANRVSSLGDFIGPKLVEQIRTIRESRMAIVREVHDCLTAMEDVRQFFLDEKHVQEMARLRDFVDTCRALVELKSTGALDTIVDAIIRLAMQEAKP